MQKTIQLGIRSTFDQSAMIPEKYTCQGADINPPIEVSGVPTNAHSLALIMEDPDAPGGTFDHWLVWNIPPGQYIKENSIPGIQGINSFGKTNYGGPCPPSGVHRYYFKIFALDKMLDLKEGSNKEELIEAMKDHIIAAGQINGKYEKH